MINMPLLKRSFGVAAAVGAAAALGCVALLHAQAQPAHLHLTSASLDALDQKLTKLLVTADKTLAVNQPLSTTFAASGLNGTALLFHRDAASEIEVHENLSDFAVVRAGAGSLLSGGKLENGRVSAPGEIRGQGRMQGGTTTKLAVGDMIYVPAHLPHQFVPDAGTYLSVMVFKPAALQPQDQPAEIVFWSAAKMNALDKELAAKLSAGQVGDAALVTGGPKVGRRASLVHRAGAGVGEVHQNDGEMTLVRSGSGTVTVGGRLGDGKAAVAGEQRGSSVEGGSSIKFAQGDVLYLPAGIPHRFVPDAGAPFSVVSFRFPPK
jgi:uncharacterized RmlC-like cupin family protein